jgi:hypothetical protein
MDNSNETITPGHPTAQQVRLALCLGWSISEVYGRIHKGAYFRKPRERLSGETPPRLSFSDREFTEAQRLWLTSRRITALTTALLKELGMGQGESEEMLPRPIRNLPRRVKSHIDDPHAVPRPTEQELYELFEDWSADFSITLNVYSGLLSLAFTFGASLADTYWYMRPARRFGRGKSPESWHELLIRQRLTEIIRRVRRLEPYLPPGVGPALRHSLWEWGIAQELERHRGQVRIAYPRLYRWRFMHWVRRIRANRMAKRWVGKVGEERFVVLKRGEEKGIYRNLKRQARVWSDLIHGSREPREYLLPSDWRQVRWMAFAASILTFGVALVLGVSLLLTILFRVFISLVVSLQPMAALPTELKDWLAVATTLATTVFVLTTQTGRVIRGMVNLYRSFHGWLVRRKIEQRTLVAWDGRVKSLFFICLEGLTYTWQRE